MSINDDENYMNIIIKYTTYLFLKTFAWFDYFLYSICRLVNEYRAIIAYVFVPQIIFC